MPNTIDLGGVFFQNSNISVQNIPDGTSNTLYVGETMYDESIPHSAALWAGVFLASGSIYVSNVFWAVDVNYVINGTASQCFGSHHNGGANFAFCDGSVRFVRNNIDPNLVQYLSVRNDGMVAPLE